MSAEGYAVEAGKDSSFFIAALPADTTGLHAAPVHADAFLDDAALLGTPPLLGDGIRLAPPVRRPELGHDEHPADIGFGGHSQGKRRFPLSVNAYCLACKKIHIRFCRRTSAVAIAGMARKRGCSAPPM